MDTGGFGVPPITQKEVDENQKRRDIKELKDKVNILQEQISEILAIIKTKEADL